jgi:hypothetical protein
MRTLLKMLGVTVIGVALGLALTWATVIRGTLGGETGNGPWRTSLFAGTSRGGPYLKAQVAVHGLLALGRGETIYYTAARDSAGDALDGACTYRISGRDPPARWWSITAYGADDYLIPNPAKAYSVSKNAVHRDSRGAFAVTLSKAHAGGDWIALADGRINLSLRLYNPDPRVADDPSGVVLPGIVKVSCP